ncbi:ABC transporter ATP-binding protein [Scopulibacillus cellulosilyticus]|uniref:ABC transporter ATP-binding protein n=1 Tax=Scopulibacillus cellulosilyticus TaxID=2665665 RepID=A0ABW2PWW8_9BACL
MAYLNVNQVTKYVKNKLLLDSVSFSIEKGTLNGLTGPSGSGKSTLVKAIAGIEHYTKGTIDLEDTALPNRKVLKRIGYMPQTFALFPDLSADQHIKYFAGLYKLPRNKFLKRTNDLFEMVHLSDVIHQPVYTYSEDMKRRLSLILALFHTPSLAILDNPTTGLDISLKEIIWKEFRKLASIGASLIIVTNELEEAGYCDQLLYLNNGKVMIQGTESDFIEMTGMNSLKESLIFLGSNEDGNESNSEETTYTNNT